jgi:pimeloyl-ACP methyl ester carboxylesterase
VVIAVIAGDVAAAQVPAVSEREVTFRSGDTELHGTLLQPVANQAVPAVVFLHGSGPATREGARPYAMAFAQLGIASLIFDKRGSGASQGSWETASLDDLVSDALAAVGYLKSEPNIDPTRIGLWGVSQAGWVAPVAASRSPDVAFLMLVSGGGATPLESEMFSYQGEFQRAGLTPVETAQATEILDAYFAYLGTGERRADLLSRLEGLRPGTLSPLADMLGQVLPSEANLPNWSWVATHDPGPYIELVRSPVLLMFGDRDTSHPTELSVSRWREGLQRAGNTDVTIMVFPGAGHGIRMRDGQGNTAPFAAGYLEAQLGWLWLHVLNAGP